MPKKPKTSGNIDTTRLNIIDAYKYPEYDRASIPPVGIAQYDTIASPETKYDHNLHTDSFLEWAGKMEDPSYKIPTTSNYYKFIKNHKIIRSVHTFVNTKRDPWIWLFETDEVVNHSRMMIAKITDGVQENV